MKLTLGTLLLLFVSTYSHAQTYKFGDVPIEQLEMTVYDKDSSAKAVVLFDKGETLVDYYNDEYQVKFKRHVRIKILTDEGLEYGDISIDFRKAKPEQSVSKIKAETYNLRPDGKIEKSSVGRRDRYTEKISDSWSQVKFTLPNLRKGSVFEYSYELHSNNPMDFPDWFFQREIPTIWSGYVAQIPEWFVYETVRRGYHFYSKFDQKTYQDRIVFGYGANSFTYDYEGTEYDMEMVDIPALTSEPYMKASIDYLAHMRFELASIEMPNSTKRYYMGSWPSVKDLFMRDEDYGKRLKSHDEIEELLSSISISDSAGVDDMINIYNLVSSSIEWDDRISSYCFDGLNKIVKEGKGNGTCINFVLIQALREVGFEAYPLAISTRSHGEIIGNLPTASQFNHSVAYVKIGDEYFVLDAKNEKRPYDILPAGNLNGSGLLIKDGNIEWIPLESKSRNNITKFITMSIDDVGISGGIESKYHGIFAMDIRKAFEEEDSAQVMLQKEYSLPETAEINLGEFNDDFDNGLFEYSADFKSEWDSELSSIIYFNPIFTDQMESNPFSLEERSYPVDYDYPFDKNIIVDISIPEGWVVDEVPESVLHRLPQRAGEFRRIVQNQEGKIVVNYRIRINKVRFMPNEYDVLKAMYDQVVTNLAENIVLKKEG